MAKTYTPLPRLSGVSLERFRVVVEVVSGEATVSEGARRLRLSRNHFQALMHRGLKALGEALSPQPPGRRPTPSREKNLRQENDRLRQENDRLRRRAETTDQVLALLRGFLQGRKRRENKSKHGHRPVEDE